MNKNTQETINSLRMAQDMLDEAAETVRMATRGTSVEDLARRCCVSAIQQAAHEKTEWLGGYNGGNIDALIRDLEQNAEDEGDAATSGEPVWCNDCGKFVEPEEEEGDTGRMEAVCPFCGSSAEC